MFDLPAYHDDDEGDDDFEPAPVEPLTHDGMPISGWHGGEPIPDLDRIPQDRWREVLAPLSRATRQFARSATQGDVIAAGILLGELSLEDGDAVARAVSAPPPKMPAAAPPARGDRRQVNFTLGPDEHERLREAALLFAMRPTTLARVLTVRGVDRALYEHRRDT